MTRSVPMLALVVLLTGCAAVLETPTRVEEFLQDPVRHRNLASRVVEGVTGVVAAAGCFLALGPAGLLCGPAAEFLVFEYVLEPLGLTGPFWERGPRLPVIAADGSLAEPGEVFRHMTEADCRHYRHTWHPDPAMRSGGWCNGARDDPGGVWRNIRVEPEERP